MNELKDYFNAISTLNESTWDIIIPLFKEETLKKNRIFR